ncbi:hypothetical protein VUR80DRAFT_5380 [Thermomyces stellatus]
MKPSSIGLELLSAVALVTWVRGADALPDGNRFLRRLHGGIELRAPQEGYDYGYGDVPPPPPPPPPGGESTSDGPPDVFLRTLLVRFWLSEHSYRQTTGRFDDFQHWRRHPGKFLDWDSKHWRRWNVWSNVRDNERRQWERKRYGLSSRGDQWGAG